MPLPQIAATCRKAIRRPGEVGKPVGMGRGKSQVHAMIAVRGRRVTCDAVPVRDRL
jgi:hypothetical protein